MKLIRWGTLGYLALFTCLPDAHGQEAKRRWEYLNQIRREKFELVLPEVMRENDIDMWITVGREGYEEPMSVDFGDPYMGDVGYFIFTDRGRDRIERAALAIADYLLTQNGAYDIVTGDYDLREFVAERDPQTIALNYSEHIAAADGLTHTYYQKLVETLGESYASRFVSSEKLVSDYRSRRVASEIAAFARAGELSRTIAERALSNEVITPGVTTLEDVAWWMKEQLHENNLESSFGMPSVYLQNPGVDPSVSSSRIIQRGDVIAYTSVPEWGGGKVRIPLEDDAIVTHRGVEWLYPVNNRVLVIK